MKKTLIIGIGVGIVLLSLLIAIIARDRPSEQPREGWEPILIETPEVPEMIEVTVDELDMAWQERDDNDRWLMLTLAETIRVTGRLSSFNISFYWLGGITLAGEKSGEEVAVMGPNFSYPRGIPPLWETCPDGRDPRLVKRGFKEKMQIGDMLMVEGKLWYDDGRRRQHQIFSSIDRIYLKR